MSLSRVLAQSSQRRTDNRTVLLVAHAADGRWLVTRRRRPWDQLIVRWRALTLDTELASGRSADVNRLRAIRASMLVTPRARRRLARHWENILDRARQPRPALSSRVPISQNRVLAAEDDIRQLVISLRGSLPVPARGVAAANLLLTSGAGPLYRGRNQADFVSAVQDAIRYLDPSSEPMTPAWNS